MAASIVVSATLETEQATIVRVQNPRADRDVRHVPVFNVGVLRGIPVGFVGVGFVGNRIYLDKFTVIWRGSISYQKLN